MDKDRQIRFLYPPLVLLSSIALGSYFDTSIELHKVITHFFEVDSNTKIVIALLGGSSLILVLGFLLSTITIFFLRFFFIKNDFNYEIKLSEKAYQDIGKLILKKGKKLVTTKDKHYAGIVFDHGFISKNIHQWMVRRWNAFIISSSSTLALISSLIIGHWLNIYISCYWLLVVIPLTLIFITNACYSWKDSMDMVEFMTKIKEPEKQEELPENNPSQEDSGEESPEGSED